MARARTRLSTMISSLHTPAFDSDMCPTMVRTPYLSSSGSSVYTYYRSNRFEISRMTRLIENAPRDAGPDASWNPHRGF